MESILEPATKMQQSDRGLRLSFSTSNDGLMLKKIQAVHVPDGRAIDVRPLLHIVEDILSFAAPGGDAIVETGKQATGTEAFQHQTNYQTNITDMLETLSFLIDRISIEMARKCSETMEEHATAMSILSMVSNYPWDAKLVIALSAFAVNYGEFWLLAQCYNSNQLAKNLAILKQVPGILQRSTMLKSQFDTIKDLITAMLDIAKCLVEFKEIPYNYVTEDFAAAVSAAMDHIPVAIYWTIRNMLATASQITGLSGSENEFLSSLESWELSSLVHKLSSMHSHLVGLLAICHKQIDERKFIEAYQNLQYLFNAAQIDNSKVLKALINPKDDPLPLVDGANKKRVSVDVLRKRNVLLLISDQDILQDEVVILQQIYEESRRQSNSLDQNPYELVWLPVLDSSVSLSKIKQRKFENLAATMTWFTLHHPSLLNRPVSRFIKEEWRFEQKPIVVVLDPQGRVTCSNAIHMMWIWGNLAFPFTIAKEDALWKAETLTLDFLVDGIDPVILKWISEERFIFLYGGEDIEWIRNFTHTVKTVARACGIAMEMVYVGKKNPKENIRRNMAIINEEKLSHCLPDITAILYFWIRIESMWNSKHQLGKADENDPITQEIMTLLSYDGSEGYGWALLSKGSTEFTRAKGTTFLTCLSDYDLWAEDVQTKGLVLAIHDYFLLNPTPHHCNRLVLPGTADRLPEMVTCSECRRTMERYILYHCCDE
ncbi:hypothetical protein ES319_A05G374300v1 [Gossypium barbadense]|uniref:Sieve element occlusion N-terminal domain-containing protein n=3 Tax=Gossypium TaxID=3633 RepID=A0A5J5W105_GOSBA|nr:hypothetical protein ES319_A05G374300v1 [Gossypium barbadense]TYH20005.1 hypothetical protein ES288_A05G397600v1 [Gossypium darwinii]